jgi:hypothetical protein
MQLPTGMHRPTDESSLAVVVGAVYVLSPVWLA